VVREASQGAVAEAAPGAKGLKGGALGLISMIVIGVASTAPGYSIAASLGFVSDEVGLQAPAIMILAFVPMLFIAASYYYLNRADPDCGTTFSWVTRAMGPHLGWLGGWGIFIADLLVMPSLATIAASYTFLLFGADGLAANTFLVTTLGVIFILAMTWICYVGIELSARTQVFLLGAELVTLVIFAVVALFKVYVDAPPGSIDPSWSWLNPFAIDSSTALAGGVLIALFIYWGWDSAVTVNEESEDARHGPGLAGVLSTLILVAIYVVTSIAAQAFAGPEVLVDNADDVLSVLGKQVLPSPLDKLLIIAVLTSAAASTQTTILPTARTALSMGAHKAAPASLARVSAKYLTPSVATVFFGVASSVWLVGLTILSQDVLNDSIVALGFGIAFYYGITGVACVIYYRRQLFRSVKNFLFIGVAPLLGAIILFWAFGQSIIDFADPANSESGASWFGVGPPLVIGLGMLVLGIPLMILWWVSNPAFFRRRPEIAPEEGEMVDVIAPEADITAVASSGVGPPGSED
jgi:amino acid transporter